jgi:hypothetical protein
MVIDPKVEQPARTMLGHAIRHELDEIADMIGRLGGERFAACIPLWIFASAYVAVDVSGRWPSDADLREIAARAAKSATRLDIGEQEIYEYLSRVALGSQRLDEVFSDEGIGTIPLFATANLLLKFGPEEKEWWEYLDQIWDAAEAAESTKLTVLPALLLRAHRESAARGTSPA